MAPKSQQKDRGGPPKAPQEKLPWAPRKPRASGVAEAPVESAAKNAAARPSRRARLKAFWNARTRWQQRTMMVMGAMLAWPIVMTLVYGVVPPPVSNIMLLRLFSGNGIHKDWVSLDEMSPSLPAAVITSEDARFCAHHGVDWVEFSGVVEDVFDDDEGPIRGASTLSMQTARNMFLWDGRGILGGIRKVLELPLALYMDAVWTKRRMIEVYLNIVEWAPGVYGAEAASQFHFHKPVSKLTQREAALLAAVLPNPIKRHAGKPSKRVKQTASRIQLRMRIMGPYLTCLQRKKWL